jgi:F420-dependent oxidoreductase-like protein
MIGNVGGTATAAELVDQARAAEAAGLDSAWVSQGFGWDAFLALAVAAHVPRLEFGTAVVPTPGRHPVALASQALSMQAVSGNRLTLGLGAGIGLLTASRYGLPTDRPVRRMRDYLDALIPLLSEDSVPEAVAPPVLLAALGPAMLRLAGERAAGTVTWMAGPRTLGEHIVPSIGKAAAGRARPRVVAGLLTCVTNDEAGVRERIAERFGLAGQVPEYRAVLDREGVDGPADVAIVGAEASVLRQLDAMRDAGVSDFVAAPFGTAAEQRRTLDVLS